MIRFHRCEWCGQILDVMMQQWAHIRNENAWYHINCYNEKLNEGKS
jgi:hypothetical protein